ncbi:MAG TPA: ribonuclease J, partial [Terriglobales bacterium]|nr:ribonuclease J [Terriglobales bacterium]
QWTMGPFEIEPVHMTHSIIDAVALAIRTPLGVVVHTGDFKLDEAPIDDATSDLARLSEYAQQGILLLLSDSTNALVAGRTPSESSVNGDIDRIFRETKGRLFFSTFASHIHRLTQVIELSQRHGRRIAIVGRSMNTTIRIATQLGYLEFPPGLFAEGSELAGLPPEKVTHLITGSQAEPTSALVRIAEGDNHGVRMEPGDSVVFSARVIPGNERPIANLLNHIYRRGATVYHADNSTIHTSGHASRDELAEVLQLLKPRYFTPVHGEYRHLVEHCRLAQSAGMTSENTFLVENGNVLEIDASGARLTEPIVAGRVFVDGKGIGDVEKAVLRDRRHLSSDGFVLAVLAIDQRSGELIAGPDLVTRGLVEDGKHLHLEQAKQMVVQALDKLGAESRTDSIEVKEEVRKALKRFFARTLERRPVIVPFVMEM